MRKALLFALLLAAPVVAYGADNSCTDCATKTVRRAWDNAEVTDAMCCMGTSWGTCFGGYEVVLPDIGWDCIIVSDGGGDESCSTQFRDMNCGQDSGGGTGGGGGGGWGGGDDCSGGGYCPPSCFNCSGMY